MPKVAKVEPPATPPVVDAPFMITYWCGPPKKLTNLDRYKELADCGFNVAFAAIDNLWEPATPAQEEHNRKVLDYCQQTGMKAFIWDGSIQGVGKWHEAPKAEDTVPIRCRLGRFRCCLKPRSRRLRAVPW